MSAADNSKGKLFTQVVRTTKVAESDLFDPLSMFAMQETQKDEVHIEEDQSAHAAAAPAKFNGGFKEEFRTPSLTSTAVHRKSDVKHAPRSVSPAPSASAKIISTKQPTAQSSNDDESMLRFLTGEQKIMSILDSFITLATGEVVSGTLFMTNYRLVFIPSPADLASIALNNPSIYSWLQIPISSIDRIDREKSNNKGQNSVITMTISGKDFRQHRITIRSNTGKSNNSEYDIERAISVISAYAFPNNMRYVFAFTHKFSGIQEKDLAAPYDAALEFSRMGVLDNPQFRVSNANATYQLCNTYPQMLVVPAGLSDDELHSVASFRSGRRLPVLCWMDRDSGASMWRSSQPKAGVSGSSSHDEKMLDLIARSCAHNRRRVETKKLSNDCIAYIVDCRSRASAMANRAAGAGYESQTNYPSSRLDFYSISNIHAVRDSYKSLFSMMLAANPSTSSDITFTKQFEDSQWLNGIRNIIKASYDTAVFLNNGGPVLVHCSHGWDRTAQVCAVAQIFLDPYYRTFEGFKVLVEKEWVSLGHAFQMRCGHSQDRATRQEDQISPIMIQFLDCVWQIQRQCMHYFEFNARYILTVADHVYSGRFGTFLFSSDYDRDLYNSRQLCPDLWTYLQCNRNVLSNPLYTNPEKVLLPPLSQLLRNVTIWSDYFMRWSSAPSVPPIPFQLSQHLYADGMCRLQQMDGLHGESTVTVDAHGAPLSSLADFEVSAAVTSTDCWEAAYRAERMKRINVEERKQDTIQQQQDAIDHLCRLVREKIPDVSEEELSSILKGKPRAAQPHAAAAATNTPASAASSHVPTALARAPPLAMHEDAQEISSTSSSTCASPLPHTGATHFTAGSLPLPTVSMPFPMQSFDTVQSPDHVEPQDLLHHAPSLHRDVVSNGGILIHEKYQDLFVSPPAMPANLSHDSLDRGDDVSSVNTPMAADDESFYPEDDEGKYGVSV